MDKKDDEIDKIEAAFLETKKKFDEKAKSMELILEKKAQTLMGSGNTGA